MNQTRGWKVGITMIQKLARKLWEAESVIAVSFALLYPIGRIFGFNPHKYIGPYVKDGQVVADLGCATGYFTLALADSVGTEGKVYAVDVNKKMIRALEKKVEKGNYRNIESHASSAADLCFIEDRSVDFVWANTLL
jgi:SAM-dependent methyltransferase